MLHKANALKGYPLKSLDGYDGQISEIHDFYFDDRFWTIRYLIANTGNWLTGRRLLIPPYSVRQGITEGDAIAVELSKRQIEESPSMESDKPVSRQLAQAYSDYLGIPAYWGGAYAWGAFPYLVRDPAEWQKSPQSSKSWNANLRSIGEVEGYYIHATDGEIGHVEDCLLEEENWSWSDSRVFVRLRREEIKKAPEFTNEPQMSPEYEEKLKQHYRRLGYGSEASSQECYH